MLTNDEIKAIELRATQPYATKSYEGCAFEWHQSHDVLALIAEVRRLRVMERCKHCGHRSFKERE